MITIDDGKVNALSSSVLDSLAESVATARRSEAVLLTGRPGCFSAGLDLRQLATQTPEEHRALFAQLGGLLLDLWVLPVPFVCAVSGHAVAAGTLLAAAADHVVAAEGPYRWGLTEGSIGLELSDFAIRLVQYRIGTDRADWLLLRGSVLDPNAAVQAGLADEQVEAGRVLDRALEVARELANLPAVSYARNKSRLRSGVAASARAGLAADVRALEATTVITASNP